jgi:hypothetical protein
MTFHTREGEDRLHADDPSDRFMIVNDQWYFKNREQELKGPYDTMLHAEQALNAYLSCLQAETELALGHSNWRQMH